MNDHVIQPRRQGRSAYCGVCGYLVVRYRTTLQRRRTGNVVVPAHWKHMSGRQHTFGSMAALRAGLR